MGTTAMPRALASRSGCCTAWQSIASSTMPSAPEAIACRVRGVKFAGSSLGLAGRDHHDLLALDRRPRGGVDRAADAPVGRPRGGEVVAAGRGGAPGGRATA